VGVRAKKKPARQKAKSEQLYSIYWSGPLNLKTLCDFVFGFSGAGTAAPARLLMPKEIDAKRAFNRTALLVSASWHF